MEILFLPRPQKNLIGGHFETIELLTPESTPTKALSPEECFTSTPWREMFIQSTCMGFSSHSCLFCGRFKDRLRLDFEFSKMVFGVCNAAQTFPRFNINVFRVCPSTMSMSVISSWHKSPKRSTSLMCSCRSHWISMKVSLSVLSKVHFGCKIHQMYGIPCFQTLAWEGTGCAVFPECSTFSAVFCPMLLHGIGHHKTSWKWTWKATRVDWIRIGKLLLRANTVRVRKHCRFILFQWLISSPCVTDASNISVGAVFQQKFMDTWHPSSVAPKKA